MLTVDIDKNSGFCAGVIRAIGKAEEFLGKAKESGDNDRKLFSLGAIVHNDAELNRLMAQGLVTIDKEDLDEMVDASGEVLLIRAHGEPPQTYEKADSIGFEIIDCTCPVVLKLQQRIKEAYARHLETGRGQIVIFGNIGHAEVLGLIGQTDGTAVVVENPELVPGEVTEVKITVTAENGETRVYTISATRKENHVHTPVTIPGYPATCTEPGLTDGQYCFTCQTVLVEWEVIPALGHNYENGICTGCGEQDETFLASPIIAASNNAKTGKVKLTWDSVDGAVKYQIYRATSKDGEYKLMYTTSGTSYTNTKATAGKYYYYYVVAVNEDGTASAPSNIAGRTCDLPRPVVTASNNAKTGKVKLTWEAVEGAVEYKIYRATEPDGKYSHMYTTSNTTYTNTNATAGVTYYYKVVAVASKTAANSAASAVVSRTCDLAQPKVSGKVNLVGNPKLNWDKVDGAVSYKVYRAESENGSYKLMKTVTGTSYTNTNNVAGTTYYYYVVAVAENTAANSAASNVVTLTAK